MVIVIVFNIILKVILTNDFNPIQDLFVRLQMWELLSQKLKHSSKGNVCKVQLTQVKKA